MRIELASLDPGRDGPSLRLKKRLEASFGSSVERVVVIDVLCLEGAAGLPRTLLEEIFCDPVAQTLYLDNPALPAILPGFHLAIEVSYRPGVTNPEASTAREALARAFDLPREAAVQSARLYGFVLGNSGEEQGLKERLAHALYNPLIQQAVVLGREDWEQGSRFPAAYPHTVTPSPVTVETLDLEGLSPEQLAGLSRRRLLALSTEEMQALAAYYRQPEIRSRRAGLGLPAGAATDVELEMVAQTWSEHCKHKIFAARIDYSEGGRTEVIDSLFKTYIRATTEALAPARPDLLSVFHDNSGVVRFDDENLVCIKAETHNSPSALDPYGGAITGIVGVNRDILGTGLGARPLFNTNVLCFGEPETPAEAVPAGLWHPLEVLAGVHHGIVDGGNQSGIPVAAGAFLFDESFTGKPLVFCGTAGILPAMAAGRESWKKYQAAGDLAVVAGGRVGKDGIHGATFSSTALDEESPTSAVQIGDPITQRRLLDFMLEARDQGLYSGITDNGAGGISSSLGEMAQATGGIRLDLDKNLLKYPGLAPWEILVSESQERMSFALPPENLEAFLSLAERRGVEAAVVGEFTNSGYVDLFYEGRAVGSLSLEFLHDGLPGMRLPARWIPLEERQRPRPGVAGPGAAPAGRGGATPPHPEALLALLAEPNLASKEFLIRQYDHEVQAGSVIKPFCGQEADAPTDGGVFRPRYDSRKALTVTHGISPRLSDLDTYAMALAVVDEAYRAHIALGGHPDLASALDNFCWPDPVESPDTPDGAYKLAQLVRACRGLKDACLAYNLPLISGKDSMKNDARIGGKKVSVKPTLLITVLGILEDLSHATTPDFKRPGDLIYLVGRPAAALGGSYYEKLFPGEPGPGYPGGLPVFDPGAARPVYERLSQAIRGGLVTAVHDLSDGGLSVALVESALGGRLGCDLDLKVLEGPLKDAALAQEGLITGLLFSEAPGRLLLTAGPEKAAELESLFKGGPLYRLGTVESEPSLRFRYGTDRLFSLDLGAAEEAWKRFSRSLEGGRE